MKEIILTAEAERELFQSKFSLTAFVASMEIGVKFRFNNIALADVCIEKNPNGTWGWVAHSKRNQEPVYPLASNPRFVLEFKTIGGARRNLARRLERYIKPPETFDDFLGK